MNIPLRRVLVHTVALLAWSLAAAAHAQVVTPNPAPTIIKTAPYTISKPGYYQLGADLTVSATTGNIITIAASNVTLDFGGHYISGPSSTPGMTLIGVNSLGKGNLVIRNGTIADCYAGVDLNGNGQSTSLNINQRIDNMLVSHCTGFGIDLYLASYSEVTNCRVSFIGGTTVQGDAYGITAGNDARSVGNSARNNSVTAVTASTGKSYGIFGGFEQVVGNRVNEISSTTDYTLSTGIQGRIAVDNLVSDSYTGIVASIYQRKVTFLCNVPYPDGHDGGLNASN